MPFLRMRAFVALRFGAPLLYDPPLMANDPRGTEFFNEYRGKSAVFTGYCEELVAPLDFRGRKPGRYVDLDWVKAQFDGEIEVRSLNVQHFIVVHPREHEILSKGFDLESQRLGDLLHPVVFYPGDTVIEKKTGLQRVVSDAFINKPFVLDGVPMYGVLETDYEHTARVAEEDEKKRMMRHHYVGRKTFKMSQDELELHSHGNVWKLYNDPSALAFASDKEELEFWIGRGISKAAGGQWTLSGCLEQFRSGKIDCFEDDSGMFFPYRLLDCWATHRPRVRALTEKVYQTELAGEVA